MFKSFNSLKGRLCLMLLPCLFSGSLFAGNNQYGKKVSLTGNVAQMKYFYDALNEVKSKKIRIAHFGDSIIMGDIISEDLRIDMQKKFGGNGAGFISVYSDDNRMRATTFHTFSEDWNTATLYKRNPQRLELGMSGTVAIPSASSWVKYDINRNARWLKTFKTARVFYSNAQNNSAVKYTFNNAGQQSAKLKAGSGVQELQLNANNASSLKLECGGAQGTHFYGVSFENGNGVYVDNFPVKGNSGVSLVDIPANMMKDFKKYLDYKLIIINFGVNVVSSEQKNYTWYENKMVQVINEIKSAFPNTSILIVSIGDKSIKKGAKFISDPAIQQVLKAQQNIANRAGVAFWNLYEAMGGENSISKWVTSAPPLAIRDYTHLTSDGGKVVGDLLMQALMEKSGK